MEFWCGSSRLPRVQRSDERYAHDQISRESGKRMVVIQANVRGRDLGGFVSEAQDKVARITLPSAM